MRGRRRASAGLERCCGGGAGPSPTRVAHSRKAAGPCGGRMGLAGAAQTPHAEMLRFPCE